jgi:hypothetical protein
MSTTTHTEVSGVKIDLYQLSAVIISYPGVVTYLTIIPNIHLPLVVNNAHARGYETTVSTGNARESLDVLSAWESLGIDALDCEYSWITIGGEDFYEHWIIPKL